MKKKLLCLLCSIFLIVSCDMDLPFQENNEVIEENQKTEKEINVENAEELEDEENLESEKNDENDLEDGFEVKLEKEEENKEELIKENVTEGEEENSKVQINKDNENLIENDEIYKTEKEKSEEKVKENQDDKSDSEIVKEEEKITVETEIDTEKVEEKITDKENASEEKKETKNPENKTEKSNEKNESVNKTEKDKNEEINKISEVEENREIQKENESEKHENVVENEEKKEINENHEIDESENTTQTEQPSQNTTEKENSLSKKNEPEILNEEEKQEINEEENEKDNIQKDTETESEIQAIEEQEDIEKESVKEEIEINVAEEKDESIEDKALDNEITQKEIQPEEKISEENTENPEQKDELFENIENSSKEQTGSVVHDEKMWTLMLYMNETEIDKNEIKFDENINVISYSECGEFTAEINTKENLHEYINYVINNYPAQNYGLVLLNHQKTNSESGIPLLTVSSDGRRNLSVIELRKAIEMSEIDKFNFIALDTSFAASIEYCYELKNCAEYLGGVEGFVEEEGFNYKEWLSKFDSSCTDGLAALSLLKQSYSKKRNRFAAIDLSKIENLVKKLNEFCEAAIFKIVDQKQHEMVMESYVNKITAVYSDYENAEAKYLNLSDLVKKIRNKYYTVLSDLDVEFQDLIKETVCLIETKETKTWSFGKYPLTVCFCAINSNNEDLEIVNQEFYDLNIYSEDVLLFIKDADKYSAGENKDSLLNKLVYKRFGGSK